MEPVSIEIKQDEVVRWVKLADNFDVKIKIRGISVWEKDENGWKLMSFVPSGAAVITS